jgi:quinoprotein glucose dehydrogenase
MNKVRVVLLWVSVVSFVGAAHAQHGAPGGDWPHYAGDHGSTKYSPLDQITAENFDQLEIAWRWESADKALENGDLPKPYFLRATPIVIDGIAYVSTGLSQVAAIDATTGETKWVYDPKSYERGPVTHGMYHHRGVEYWTDGEEERILISTGGRQLVSIDAKTGQPDPNFGDGGWVDLLLDLGKEVNTRNIGDNKPPIVCNDTIIVGSIIMDFPTTKSNPPGHIRGYDVRTGKRKWIFHTIPQEGEFGNETWENDSWKYSGNTNAWSMMTCDDELGYVYLPIGTPTSDYYGGHRHGDNLFAESLLCLDAETGERVWHFQAVHHGIWDYDFPCAPNLVDITVDGKAIRAVAQVSKQGFTYVFDRVTGEPVWPIEEREVNTNTTVPGEKLSPTQPFPTKPPAFERQGVTEDDLMDFTPELNAEAREAVKEYVMGPIFSPNIVIGTDGKKALLQLPGAAGGANWPGASVDPDTGILYVQSATDISRMGLMKMDPNRSDLNYMISMGGMDRLSVQGLPVIKPPYRRITAIDLNKGEIAWQKPFGWGPVDHPLLKDLDLGPLGDPFPNGVIAEGGILLTKNVLVSFLVDIDLEGNAVMPSNSRLQAYDKSSGELICEISVDRHLHGSPMTYMAGGKQYIAVTGGGVKEPSELIAFALPNE